MSNQDSTAWSYKSWGISQLVQTRQSYYKLRGRIFVVRKRTRSLNWVTLSVSAEDVVKLLCGPPNRVRSWCNLSAAASMDLGTRLVFKLKWHVTTSKVKSCAYYRKNWFASLKKPSKLCSIFIVRTHIQWTIYLVLEVYVNRLYLCRLPKARQGPGLTGRPVRPRQVNYNCAIIS